MLPRTATHITPVCSQPRLVKLAGSQPFDPGRVSYLAGDGNYTLIHFTDGSTLLTAVTLRQVAGQLPELLRVHKSYAIAPGYVSALRWVKQADGKRVLVVRLRNQVRIAIPRRRSSVVAAELAQLTGMLVSG